MDYPLNYKLIFDPTQGLPQGVFDMTVGVLELFGFSFWVSAEYAPDYAVATTQNSEVIVLSTFVGFEYKTILSDDLDQIQQVLLRFGGEVQLQAGLEIIGLAFDPSNASLKLNIPYPQPDTTSEMQSIFVKLCNKLKPLAGYGYSLEALSHMGDLQDDFALAVVQKRLPKHLHNLSYLNRPSLEKISLARLEPIAQRLDYGPDGIFVWLGSSVTSYIAELDSAGLYRKHSLRMD